MLTRIKYSTAFGSCALLPISEVEARVHRRQGGGDENGEVSIFTTSLFENNNAAQPVESNNDDNIIVDNINAPVARFQQTSPGAVSSKFDDLASLDSDDDDDDFCDFVANEPACRLDANLPVNNSLSKTSKESTKKYIIIISSTKMSGPKI